MTCAEWKELTSVWFDGELDGDQFPQILRHAGECEGCRAFMSRLPRQVGLVRSSREDHADFASPSANRLVFPAGESFVASHIRAPLAAAAAIILVILTIAIERTVSDRSRESLQPWGSGTPVEQVGGLR